VGGQEVSEKYDKAFAEFKEKPKGTIIAMSNHKASGSLIFKIEDNYWIDFDHEAYGYYEAKRIDDEKAFSYCWDTYDDELITQWEEVEVK
jgi:hypothetical protein